ncbi:CobW family GTP-binding protein [Paenibacillus sp. GCM10023252]|uniref:CobW family GTP-binding protein n=1 Tax=Paenibacillus sp. GCM10023252 TaxID=3252649 RepID=UPI003606F154
MTIPSEHKRIVPVHLLSGFLGSGKTTLLTQIIDYCTAEGKRAAVIMNELGDVNLDGQLVDEQVPMAEMLSGCICCTIRGDLALELKTLVDIHHPDLIIIESTGAANPMEIIDGVTEAAMYTRIDLRSITTVADGPELLQRRRTGKGRTFKLMQEQIRCASRILLNKVDRLEPEELVEAQQLLRELNAHAPIQATVRCRLDDWSWLSDSETVLRHAERTESCEPGCEHGGHSHGEHGGDSHEEHSGHSHGEHGGHSDVEHGGDSHEEHSGHSHGEHGGDSHEEHGHSDGNYGHSHAVHDHSHDHVMALTHYWGGAVNSEAFEALLKQLPRSIYRAKGIVTLQETGSRFLFQYAYGESDFIRITPQGEVNDVAVFIGEGMDKGKLLSDLQKLEQLG